jgi:DNA-binding CsgD family transcriptional regulator
MLGLDDDWVQTGELVAAHDHLLAELETLLADAGLSSTQATRFEELCSAQRVVHDQLAARLQACERVRAAVARLVQIGPVGDILTRGAVEAAEAADLDRAIVSRVSNGDLIVEALHLRADDGSAANALEDLRHSPVRLEYPLLECEFLRRRRAQLVDAVDHDEPARHAFLRTLSWGAYVAAPVVVEGHVVGLIHGDRLPERGPLSLVDRDALEHFAFGFARVFERAVLRRRLRDQRREIRHIAAWVDSRTAELSDAAIDLEVDLTPTDDGRPSTPSGLRDEDLIKILTRRELDVLRLIADGKTNADIARTLFVSQGTVKFHVKNVLRKMQAVNRADAASRYVRLSMRAKAA